ncbi:MAG: phosphatase PAP2 family protein [Phormidesmis sp.]
MQSQRNDQIDWAFIDDAVYLHIDGFLEASADDILNISMYSQSHSIEQLMQSMLSRLADIWTKTLNPRIASFVTFFGAFWLGVCVLTVYMLAELSDEILEREAFAIDKVILLGIHRLESPTLDRLMVGITRLGDPKTVVPLTLIIFSLLLWKRHFLAAKFFALDTFGGAVLSYFLKLAFSKDRPQLWGSPITEVTYSYPSGHALGSMVLYGFLSYLVATMYPRYAKLSYGIAALLIIAIGFSRLYLGVHWPTDIIGGYGIGLLWITVCISLMRLQQRKRTL